jgi:hypothetical protein
MNESIEAMITYHQLDVMHQTIMFGDTTAIASNVKYDVQNKQLQQLTPSWKHIFDNDYTFTCEDFEVELFIWGQDPAYVAHIGDYVLTTHQLKQKCPTEDYFTMR